MDEGRIVNDVCLDFNRDFPKVFDSIVPVKIVRYGQDKQIIK